MRYTPVELRHVKLGRTTFGGYKREETDKLVEDIADSFEEVWRDRGELADKLEDVEKILAEVKQRESLLSSTLIAAEKASAAQQRAKPDAEKPEARKPEARKPELQEPEVQKPEAKPKPEVEKAEPKPEKEKPKAEDEKPGP